MKYIITITLLFYIFIYSSSQAYSKNIIIQPLIDELAEAGHRDIKYEQVGDTLKIIYWPIGFRDDYQGYEDLRSRVLKFLEYLKSNEVTFIELTQTSWGIPTITSQIQLNKSFNTYNFTKKYSSTRKLHSSSIYYPSKRLMILFGIPLSASFGQYYDPLIFKVGVRPELRFRLYAGLLAYGQIDFYFHNEYDTKEFYRPGNIGIMAARTFYDRIISVTNIGAFHTDLYGFDEEIQISLLDDKISLGLHVGYYGDLFWKNNMFRYRPLNHKLSLLRVSYSFENYDSKIELKGGQFLYGDKGVGFEINRVFKEVEIGFTGIKTKDDIVANIHFSIPFYPKTRKSLANYGIAPVKHFKLRYRFYSNDLGREPEISTSLKNIEGIASPNHFKYMSQTFRKY